jgi:hypothetical protein
MAKQREVYRVPHRPRGFRRSPPAPVVTQRLPANGDAEGQKTKLTANGGAEGQKKTRSLRLARGRLLISVRSKKRRAPTRLSVFAKLSCNSLSVIVDHLHPKAAFHLCVAYGLGSQDVPAFRQARGRILRDYRRSYINRLNIPHWQRRTRRCG